MYDSESVSLVKLCSRQSSSLFKSAYKRIGKRWLSATFRLDPHGLLCTVLMAR